MTLTIDTRVSLNTGTAMPLFGLGTWKIPEGPGCERAVSYAAQLGYRLFDTASAYGNEHSMGKALRESDLPREELFVTSKVWIDEQGYDTTLAACRASLQRMGLDYLDLYLIHWPEPGHWQEAWRAMLRLRDEGLCRAIGVSNFAIHHLEELRGLSPIMPAVNQVEFSPFQYKRDLLDYCRAHSIHVEGYSPLTRGSRLDHPIVRKIAARHGKTPAQILIRWPLQHGVITIPKAASPAHIRENAMVFDFALTEEDMAALDSIEEQHSITSDSWRARFA